MSPFLNIKHLYQNVAKVFSSIRQSFYVTQLEVFDMERWAATRLAIRNQVLKQ